MRGSIGLTGPLALAAGMLLLLPDPHPWMGGGLALAIGVAGAVLALVGVLARSQLVVALGSGAAVVVALPAQLPIGPLGPLLQVAGLAIALEGARARKERVPMPPPRAWGLPILLALVGSLVVIGALATTVGRESLDITQGIGLAVSVPFLLLAAWAILRLLSARTSGPATAILLAALLLPGMLALAPGAEAQAGPPGQSEDWNHFGHTAFIITDLGARNATFGWTMNTSRVLLIDFHFDQEDLANTTISTATLSVQTFNDAANPTGCAQRAYTLERALGPWGEHTTLETVPDGTEPRTESRTLEGCSAGGDQLSFNVTEHVQAWADGETINGWRLRMTAGGGQDNGGQVNTQGDLDPNAPRIQSFQTEPEMREEGIVMAPVGGQVWVNASINDPRGGMRNASLDFDGDRATNASLPSDEHANLSLDITEAVANGTLALQIQDWDKNTHRVEVGELRPDRTRPGLRASEGHSLEVRGNRWTVPDPIPLDRTRRVSVNLSDDACALVARCVELLVENATGGRVANVSGPGDVRFQLPTHTPGDHQLRLTAVDAALRERTVLLEYRVSEPDPPTISNVGVRGALDRATVQEAGLPVRVRLTTSDVSPPLTANLTVRAKTLDSVTLDVTNETVRLSGTIQRPGKTTLTLDVTDRWGNTQTVTRPIEIVPAAAPVIDLPTAAFLGPNAEITATVQDVSVDPDVIDVDILSDGTNIAAASIERTLQANGVELRITMPTLLDGETVQLVVDATDALDQRTTEQASYTIDLEPPRLEIEPSVGRRIGENLWTHENASLAVSASDDGSGLASLRIVRPFQEDLDPEGTVLNVSRLGTREIRIVALDAIGNEANWTGQLRIDEQAPRLDLAIDGHDLLLTVTEEESGLATLRVTHDGDPIAVPAVTGTHRVTLTNVTRGDTVSVTARATDGVGLMNEATRELTVGDGPPTVRVSAREGRQITIQASDPDGDNLTVEATVTHDVNGTQRTIPIRSNGNLVLPDWRGDVTVRVQASANGATRSTFANTTLGEAPFLHASKPATIQPGQPTEITVTWERNYHRVTLIVLQNGVQQSVHPVTPIEDGRGTVTLDIASEGTYTLELNGEHKDGTVQTASAGQIEVSEGISNIVLILIALALVALAGLAALFVIREREEGEQGSP